MMAALVILGVAAVALVVCVACRPARPAPRDSFALAYIHRNDVAHFVAQGWHEVGVDPRYGSVIMRYDGPVAATPKRGTVLGRGV